MQLPQDKPGEIHPTAIIHPKASLGKQVSVGPYCVIGANVTIGDGCSLESHVTINGRTTVGRGNRFFSHCAIGGDPQDKKYQGEADSRLEIGDNNLFREFCTINRGTGHGGGVTRLGNSNWFMAYCHVAHDCTVGNDVIFANASTLGGHCTVEDRVYMGGFTAVHQFCTIGTLTITGGQTMVAQDIPPFLIASGNRVRPYGVNKVGMERAGFSPEQIREIQNAYKIFFRGRLSTQDALARLDAEFPSSPNVRRFAQFIRDSKRGICR